MKKSLIISILFLLFYSGFLFAQDLVPIWKETDPTATISLIPKSRIYEVPQYSVTKINELQHSLNSLIAGVSFDNKKSKRLSKGAVLPVVGYHRSDRRYDFDIYIVEYQGAYFYAPASSVEDNSLLQAKNRQIELAYSSMLDELNKRNEAYQSVLKAKSQEADRMLAKYEGMDSRKYQIVDSTFQARLAERVKPMQDEYNQWFATLSPSAVKATESISINDAYLSAPNSASGCNYNMTYTNRTNKTIKYLYWYGNVYNAVGDKVSCEIRGNYSFSGKDTGPVEPGKKGGGTWDCIIYNWSAKTLRFTSIKIIYTDGSSITIAGKDAEAISKAPRVELYDYQRNTLQSETRRELFDNIDKNLKNWRFRRQILDNWDLNKVDTYRNSEFFSSIAPFADDYIKYSKEVAQFEEDNYLTKP